MKKLILFALPIALLLFVQCKTDTSSSSKSPVKEVPKVAEKVVKEVKKSVVTDGKMLNPNLSSASDMIDALAISKELAAKIVASRPFLDMVSINTMLATELDGDEIKGVYKKMFLPLNLNTASDAEFKMIPGVGDKMAHEFEEYRPYKKMAQFEREMGKYVDDKVITEYKKYIFIPVNLNTATEEEILALPGVGKKMAHEFEEYRPYKDMSQFRRQIGKYVDDKELKRLERFVVL